MKKTLPLVGIFYCLFAFLMAAEPVDILDDLMSSDKSPRPLSSEDIGLSSNTPLPLQPLQGDFNADGIIDHVISGIYNLPNSKNRYFLLVGAERGETKKGKTLFFREFSEPVFLHPQGSTGEADPGNQSFSISFCQECDQGLDFYWDKKNNMFQQKTWSARIVKSTKLVEIKVEDVPADKVDAALKMVGALPDVLLHIKDLQKRDIPFKTRVEPLPDVPQMERVRVRILEGKKESVWDEIDVDLMKQEIVKRKRKVKSAVRGKS